MLIINMTIDNFIVLFMLLIIISILYVVIPMCGFFCGVFCLFDQISETKNYNTIQIIISLFNIICFAITMNCLFFHNFIMTKHIQNETVLVLIIMCIIYNINLHLSIYSIKYQC